MPPFKIRNKTELNAMLGNQSIVDGYVPKPIYNYMNATWDD